MGSNRDALWFLDWRMSFSENRFPLFRDMRQSSLMPMSLISLPYFS